MGERPHAKANTAALAAIAAAIDLGPDAPPVELCNQSAHGAELEIKAEDGADRLCLLGHDFKFLVEAAIAERNGSADPEALAFRGRDFVTHPLADHLTLELGKGEQHIEGEPPTLRSRANRASRGNHQRHLAYDLSRVDPGKTCNARDGWVGTRYLAIVTSPTCSARRRT